MPKGKRKGGRKSSDRKSTDSRPASEEEYDTADNWSTASVISEDPSGSLPEEDEVEEASVDETSAQEEFEEKLKDCVEGLTQKSAQGRKSCLEYMIKCLSKKYLYDFLIDRKVTISDALIRCLKKGKGDEQALAAQCCSILCIQLGADAEDVMLDMRPTLLTVLADNSSAVKARGECAIAVSMCAFIASMELENVVQVMTALESVFKLSFRKGDNTIPNNTPQVCSLHANAISAWSLLLSIAPQHLIDKMAEEYLHRLPDMLSSQDIDLRIVAGETIALFYELGRSEDEDFELDNIDDLCDKLKQLSTESHKYRAKRDRRQQKSSFRDILRAVQEGEAPEMTIKFAQESLEIYTWVKKMQYSAFCQALGSGVYQHLQLNVLVRDVFELGEPMLVGTGATNKPTKWERTLYNAAAFKARTKARAKFRDKRSVMMNGTE